MRAHFRARFLGGEHPFDAVDDAFRCRSHAAISDSSNSRVGMRLSSFTAQDANLDFNHVKPTGILWSVAELRPAKHRLASAAGKVWHNAWP